MNHGEHGVKYEKLTQEVIGCAIEVHRVLGPGLLEATYEQCLARELSLHDIPFKLQVPIPIEYKGVKLDCGYRIDILVRDKLIVELKSAEKILPIHEAQIFTYMKLSSITVGLIINFNVTILKQGIKRFVL